VPLTTAWGVTVPVVPSVAVKWAVSVDTLAGVTVVSNWLSPLWDESKANWDQSHPPARTPIARTARQAVTEPRPVMCFMVVPP
jgi:hypothetical protein